MLTLRVVLAFVFIGLVASCSLPSTPIATNTSLKTLVVRLWVDYPVVQISVFTSQKYKQYANILVTDTQGRPVANATILALYITTSGKNKIKIEFLPTNSNGESRVLIPLMPISNSLETHAIIVNAILDNNSSNEAKVMFDILP